MVAVSPGVPSPNRNADLTPPLSMAITRPAGEPRQELGESTEYWSPEPCQGPRHRMPPTGRSAKWVLRSHPQGPVYSWTNSSATALPRKGKDEIARARDDPYMRGLRTAPVQEDATDGMDENGRGL